MSHMHRNIKMTLKGKHFQDKGETKTLSGHGQMDRIFMNLKKEIKPRGYSDPVLGLNI